jgi:hypothetical protein
MFNRCARARSGEPWIVRRWSSSIEVVKHGLLRRTWPEVVEASR